MRGGIFSWFGRHLYSEESHFHSDKFLEAFPLEVDVVSL